ncbi:MAG: fatty acid desaturase [Gemmataceae bacterium]
MPETINDSSVSKSLFAATKPFAEEIPLKSWWVVISTFVLLIALLVGAAVLSQWPIRVALSLLGGLVMVRAFILYHDFMHSALLHESKIGKVIFYTFGLLVLSPPRYWRYSHNYHHANVGKPVHHQVGPLPQMISDIGSFPLMNTQQWQSATFGQRLLYRVVRHPLTILFAYLTVFTIGLCILPLFKNPKRYWDGALSIIVHGGMIALLWGFFGFPVVFYTVLLPTTVAAAIGAYMFYAQHNYEGMHVVASEEWSYYLGSIHSSSFMKLGPIMRWFSGNIGYHHIHHLNSRIPFYRLPESMKAIPELQNCTVTTLNPLDIFKCFYLNLWDTESQKLVGYGEAKKRPVTEKK